MSEELSIGQIIDDLTYPKDKFPRNAVKAAIEKQEEITPELLDILEIVHDDLEEIEPDVWDHIFAVYLLAQFREERAYPIILKLFATPGDAIEDAYGDVITEDLGRILASVSGGDPEPIKQLAENSAANAWVRGAALDALVTMVCAEYLPREDVIEYFQSLYTGKISRDPDNYLFWSQLVSATCNLYPEELSEEIKQAFADELIDPMYIRWEGVDYQIKQGKHQTLRETCRSPRHSLVEDTIKELKGWAAFQQPGPNLPSAFTGPHPEPIKSLFPPMQQPVTSERTLGRNDPCWCGSGKKYKNCHWREDQMA